MNPTPFSTLRAATLSVAAFVATLPLCAQDYDLVAPKPVPTTPARAELPAVPPPATGDETLLTQHLRGVVVLDKIDAVQAAGASVEGYVASSNPLTQTDTFRALVEPRLGKPLTMRELNTLAREIVLYFRAQDRPLVDVVVPEQDITAGVVQIVVVEGRAGRVRVEGNRWFSSQRIERGLRLTSGEPILASVLSDDIAWINQNPFRAVDVVFAPGERLGETDIVLRAHDRLPLRLYTGYENTGNDLTGETRLFAGVNWGDAFFIDGQLNYQFSASDDFDAVRSHSVSWAQTLPWRHTLSIFGAHVRSKAETGPFMLSGKSSQAGLRYTAPLPAKRNYSHELYAGFDWKRADNALEFGIPISNSLTQIGQWIVGYRGTYRDAHGATQFQIEGVKNAPGLFSHQDDADYAGSRPGADSDYSYARIELSRFTRLPADFTLSHAASAQIASTNLLPSEQISVGGRGSVRGYEEHALSASDEGWTIQNELRAPPFALASRWLEQEDESRARRWNDQVQFLVFYDYGRARSDDHATGWTTLASIGAGVRYTLGSYVNVQADYGHRLRDIPGDNENGRWHISAMLSW